MVIARAWGRLCFGWAFPSISMRFTVWTSSPTSHETRAKTSVSRLRRENSRGALQGQVLTSSSSKTTLRAGNLPVTDPLVSPLYGSLKGLPPTYVYSGSLDSLAPDVVVLDQEAATQGAPISFVLRTGEIHDWVLLSPDGFRYLPQIYQELGI